MQEVWRAACSALSVQFDALRVHVVLPLIRPASCPRAVVGGDAGANTLPTEVRRADGGHRSGLHSGFRLRGKQHIQSNKRQRQHLPRGRGTCRMRRLSFDF